MGALVDHRIALMVLLALIVMFGPTIRVEPLQWRELEAGYGPVTIPVSLLQSSASRF